MNKKTGIIIGALILLIIGGAGYFLVNQAKNERLEKIALAKSYADNDEYVRALGILEALLVTDPNDQEALDLIKQFSEMKEEYDKKVELEKEQEREAEKLKSEQERLESEERLKESLLESQKEKEEEERRERIKDLIAEMKSVFSKDQLKEAETLRKEILKLDPSNTTAKDYKNRIAQRERELENKKERDLRLKKEREVNNLLSQAESALKNNNLVKAENLYNKALALDENNLKALKGLADIAIKRAQEDKTAIPQGIDRISKVLAEEPDNYDYLKSLAELYGKNKDYKNELSTLDKVLKIKPTAEFFVKAGIASYKLKQYKGANNYFQLAVDIDSSYPETYYPMALTYEKLNKNNKREEMLKKSISLRPDHAASHYELGRVYTDREDFKGALELFLKANTLKPNSVKYKMGVGLAHFNLGQYSMAIDIYEAIIKVDQSISEVYYNLSKARMKQEAYTQALVDISMAIKLKPTSPTYLYTIGEISEAIGREDNAETYYLNAIKLDSKYYKPMLNLGNIYDRQGKYQSAIKLLKNAYDLKPDDSGVKFSLGTAYLHNKEYDKSLKYLEKAYKEDKASALKLYTLSLAYTEVGSNAEAEEGFKKVIEMDYNYFDAYFYLGQLLFSLDRKDEARTFFEKVLELNPEYNKKQIILDML